LSSGPEAVQAANTAEGHGALIAMIQQMPAGIKVGFEATGGQEWVLWPEFAAAEIAAVQLSPAQVKAFAPSRATRAKTDRIDAELIARLMAFRPEAGRELPGANPRVLRTLTTRRGQLVDMRKRLKAQIDARKRQGFCADVETMDDDLEDVLDARISVIERRIENGIAETEPFTAKANLLRSIPGIGPVSAAMLIAELPELGRMTSGEAAAMTSLAPGPHDSAARRGSRTIAGGTTLSATCAVPGSPRSRLPQSGSQASRKPPQTARKVTQTRHHRNRTKAGHNRQRDHQNRHTLAVPARRTDTVARVLARYWVRPWTARLRRVST
jgi:transposase